jgi:hypothetical protein
MVSCVVGSDFLCWCVDDSGSFDDFCVGCCWVDVIMFVLSLDGLERFCYGLWWWFSDSDVDDLWGFGCLAGSEMVYVDWEILGSVNVWIGGAADGFFS